MDRKRDVNMTQGVIWKQLLTFMLPLLVGNLFQQLYNTVDSMVVGNYVGKDALAAVTGTSVIVNTLIGVFMGFAAGAGVVIAQAYGAGDVKKLRRAVHTSVSVTFIASFGFAAFGYFVTPLMLRMMRTPSSALAGATTYLRIYFLGVGGLMMYNIGAGILRAVGDSRRPLYFLILSTVLNIGLDLLFVVIWDKGVAGVAYATIISQFISAALVLLLLFKSREDYSLRFKELRPTGRILKQIVSIGLPAAVQQGLIAFSNVFVQSYINAFDTAAMAGWGIRTRVEAMIFLPMQSMALATTTFVGQNAGAQKPDRIRKGIQTALSMSLVLTAVLSVLTFIFAREMAFLFNQEEDVLYYSVLFLRFNLPFMIVAVFNQIYAAALRGVGDSRMPMVVMLLSFVGFRQIFLYIGSRMAHSLYFIAFAYPAGWIICSVILYGVIKSGRWERDLARYTPKEASAEADA